MKKVFMAIGVLIAMTGLAYAGNGFDADLSNLRKGTISMCSQLQAGKPRESQEQLLKEIDDIIGVWEGMAAAYKNAPPAEYAKDPAWKGYFDEVLDNFRIMRQKTEGKDYGRAMQFCGQNCGLFVKIHQVNGRVTLSDKMFALRQNARLAISMTKAANWDGAAKMLKHTSEFFAEIDTLPVPAGVDRDNYMSDVKQIKASFNELAIVVNKKDIKTVDVQMKLFLIEFGKIYVKYV